MLENMNWYEVYDDLGISGSLEAFSLMVNGLITAGQHNDINNLLQSSLSPTEFAYGDKIIEISYQSNNTGIVDIDGYSWTGMIIKNDPVQNASDVSNQAVFFNAEVIQGSQEDVRMFVVDSGDFETYPMLELDL